MEPAWSSTTQSTIGLSSGLPFGQASVKQSQREHLLAFGFNRRSIRSDGTQHGRGGAAILLSLRRIGAGDPTFSGGTQAIRRSRQIEQDKDPGLQSTPVKMSSLTTGFRAAATVACYPSRSFGSRAASKRDIAPLSSAKTASSSTGRSANSSSSIAWRLATILSTEGPNIVAEAISFDSIV